MKKSIKPEEKEINLIFHDESSIDFENSFRDNNPFVFREFVGFFRIKRFDEENNRFLLELYNFCFAEKA